MAKWINTKHEGVRFREHPIRKFGVRRDRYYSIRFYLDGRRIEESLGWESHWKQSHPGGSISLGQEAVARRAVLMRNQRDGSGPHTLAESRAEKEIERKKDAAKVKANPTLGEFWAETYFPICERSKKKGPSSREAQQFKRWIAPVLGKLRLRSIGLPQWDQLAKTLAAAGLSPRSKEYICGTLRRALKVAHERQEVSDPPPPGRRIGITGPGNNHRTRVISYAEEAAIMDRLAEVDVSAWRITRFSFLTGCRISEAVRLKWGAVNLPERSLTFFETKNGEDRVFPISASLVELLESVPQGGPNDLVFTQQNGNRFLEAPRSFVKVVKDLKLNEGRTSRDRLVWHSIRHSTATRLGQRLGVRDLADLFGWKKIEMAMRYCHGNQSAKMNAIEMLGTPPVAGKVLPFRGGETQQAPPGRANLEI